jgi:hypothetical protein
VEFEAHLDKLIEQGEPLRQVHDSMIAAEERHHILGPLHPEVLRAEGRALKKMGGIALSMANMALTHPVKTINMIREIKRTSNSQQQDS